MNRFKPISEIDNQITRIGNKSVRAQRNITITRAVWFAPVYFAQVLIHSGSIGYRARGIEWIIETTWFSRSSPYETYVKWNWNRSVYTSNEPRNQLTTGLHARWMCVTSFRLAPMMSSMHLIGLVHRSNPVDNTITGRG